MKAIIPAKCNSSRVLDKNWREFHKGKCLVEIKIGQLIDAGLNPSDIHVFCEDQSKRDSVEITGATFELRDIANTRDDMHWSDVVTNLVSSIDADDDESIAWTGATSPLFDGDDNRKVIDSWNKIQSRNNLAGQKRYDCIITVKRLKEFVLDGKGRPVNYNFGRWHEWSQDLPQWYILESPIHIMKKKDYLKYNYFIGKEPYLYEVSLPSIDIDEIDEFLEAQELYRKLLLDS
jgi:CMP-N-acetylneuraminic acid synthetase